MFHGSTTTTFFFCLLYVKDIFFVWAFNPGIKVSSDIGWHSRVGKHIKHVFPLRKCLLFDLGELFLFFLFHYRLLREQLTTKVSLKQWGKYARTRDGPSGGKLWIRISMWGMATSDVKGDILNLYQSRMFYWCFSPFRELFRRAVMSELFGF